MVLFLKHDFFNNYNAGLKYNDTEYLKSLIKDELAKSITFDRKKIINILKSQGIQFKEYKNDRKLIDEIYKNKNNESLLNRLVENILDKNEEPIKEANKEEKFLLRGYQTINYQSQVTPDIKKNIIDILKSFDSNDKSELNQIVETHKNNKSMITDDSYFRKKLIKTALISSGITMLFTAGVLLSLYYYNKKKNTNSVAQNTNPVVNDNKNNKLSAQDMNEDTYNTNSNE